MKVVARYLLRCAGVICLLPALLAGCVNLPATTPVTARIAGQDVAVGVDSPEAAYYLGRYLQGEREWPELDARLDALHRGIDARELPGREILSRLSAEFSVDFAAIYFADRVYRLPANRLLRRTYEAHLAQAMKDYFQKADRSLLPEAADYTMIFVPAYNYESHTNTGADLGIPRVALRAAGLSPLLIPTTARPPRQGEAARSVPSRLLRSWSPAICCGPRGRTTR